MENQHPSTILSMDLSPASSHEEMNHLVTLTRPPDINLPLSSEPSPPPQPWNIERCDILDVGLGTQVYETESFLSSAPKALRKCAKRVDSIWGAWCFFTFYFKPVMSSKSKAKLTRDSNGVSGFDKSDLQLDTFLVQHDMENMYMWVFKERPENALGKMQLRSYMNGNSRQGDRPFPFSTERGFVRSHRMQRKHYRGLSNPQCVHGIELVPSPNLTSLDEDGRKRWTELTGRDTNFTIPPEASDYGSWRNLPTTEFELERVVKGNNPTSHAKKLLNGSVLNNMLDLPHVFNKRKKDDEDWLGEFSGVVRSVCGPVTAAKAIYEDDEGYLIVVSLPLVDLPRVRVSWRNTLTHGVVKVSCFSTSRAPSIKRLNRTFKLTDRSSEHCPAGEFVREIPLATRIPEDASIEAYYNGQGSELEILVPKLQEGPEEHEVRVCLRM